MNRFLARAGVVFLLCLMATLVGCTNFPMRSQQVWRSLVDYGYPSEPVGSPAFEAALDKYTDSLATPVYASRLLQDGDEAYPVMLELIENAKTSISFETYILEGGNAAKQFFAALLRAAERGVQIRLLADAAGFRRNVTKQLNALCGLGAEARIFNPFWSWTILRVNNRDHRKILVVDSKHAVLGGINISDKQLGNGVSGWRDTALMITGPGAAQAERVFFQTWKQGGRGWLGKNLPMAFLNPIKNTVEAPFTPADPKPVAPTFAMDADVPRESGGGGDCAEPGPTARIVASSPDCRRSPLYDLSIIGILGARERLDITCAYFVPPLNLRRALLAAAERGVKVRLLLPKVTDVKLVREMGMRFYGEFLQAGIEIYEWPYPILHAKTMAVDGRWLVVGSSNLDSRSFFLNYEAVIALSDPIRAEEAHAQFELDLKNAHPLSLAQWRSRGLRQRAFERLLIPLAGHY